MPSLTVDGTEIEYDDGMTVLQVCELAGKEIPRFCYHDRLKIAGNCRMCLVEIEGGPPKPAASCAMPAGNGMKVHTNSPMVKKAREGVMEFQLINHPLDCPICDQGGECDLQDQAMKYGRAESRFKEKKHSVKDKNYGPLIKTYMTRCIHCTRCVRFMSDIAGCEEIGGTGRGENMEIGTFIEKNITSELSGNIIDICPVGALTSKPYSYTARSWELKHTNSIDVTDAVGCNIRVDTRGNQVMRVLPSLHEDINEIWLSDKSRFSYDGLRTQRLDTPYIKVNNKLVKATWEEAYSKIKEAYSEVKPEESAVLMGDLTDSETMALAKDLFSELGSDNIDCRQDGSKLGSYPRVSYIFNTTIASIEEADSCLIIGSNPRYDASLINARIKKRKEANPDFEIAVIGEDDDLTYDFKYLGDSIDIIDEFVDNKHAFSKVLKKSKKPMIILGSDLFTRGDSEKILGKVNQICENLGIVSEEWNGFNILQKSASRVAGLDLGCIPQNGGKDTSGIIKGAEKGEIKFLYLLGADEVDLSKKDKSCFVIYQGHHGDNGAHAADVILPAAAYTEKSATYVNTEGRVQRTTRAVFPVGEAKEDWKIIVELSELLDKKLPYNNIEEVRERLIEINSVFADLDIIRKEDWVKFGKDGSLNKEKLKKSLNAESFFKTDVICRASKVMAECIESIKSENMKKKKSSKVQNKSKVA